MLFQSNSAATPRKNLYFSLFQVVLVWATSSRLRNKMAHLYFGNSTQSRSSPELLAVLYAVLKEEVDDQRSNYGQAVRVIAKCRDQGHTVNRKLVKFWKEKWAESGWRFVTAQRKKTVGYNRKLSTAGEAALARASLGNNARAISRSRNFESRKGEPVNKRRNSIGPNCFLS